MNELYRIICPEAAVNGQFYLENRFFLNCLKNSKIFRKFAWKNRNLLTRIHDPQISNQIDATEFHAWMEKADVPFSHNIPFKNVCSEIFFSSLHSLISRFCSLCVSQGICSNERQNERAT